MPNIKKIKDKIKMVELFTACIALWWAIALAQPVSLLTLIPSYHYMAVILPSYVWSIISLAIGLSQIVVMFLKNKVVRQASLLVATSFWSFVSVTFSVSDFALYHAFSTACGVYAIIACMTAWAYMRVGLEREPKKRKRKVKQK